MDLELVGFLGDVLLEDLGLGGLGIAKVHHFVEKLVDDDKVVANRLFLEGFEVLGEDLDDLVEEEEDFGGIGVALGEGEEVEVVVADVEVLWPSVCCMARGERLRSTHVDAFVGEAGRDGRRFFFGFGEEDRKLFYRRHGNITPVVAGEKGLPREKGLARGAAVKIISTVPFHSEGHYLALEV